MDDLMLDVQQMLSETDLSFSEIAETFAIPVGWVISANDALMSARSSQTGLPAYGRDYKSAAAVRADWAAGKDFRIALTGQYFSIRDADLGEVWIRYANGTRTVKVK